VLWAQRCTLICERKIGEMLIAMKERKELREGRKLKTTVNAEDHSFSKTISLEELGVSRYESSDAQMLASIPEPVLGFEHDKVIQSHYCLGNGDALSTDESPAQVARAGSSGD
jgi:hypothetical protein